MKSVIGGIIGGSITAIIVISFILLVPTDQIVTIQEVIKKETMHPCKKAMIDDFQLYKKNAQFLSSPYTAEDFEEWKNEFAIKERNINQLVLDNDCGKIPNPDWLDDEFKKEYQAMVDAGF